MSGDHSNYRIIEVGPSIEKSTTDHKRLAVTQIPVKGHQLTQMRKIRTELYNNNNRKQNQNNTVRTNCVTVRIKRTQENNKYRLCWERDERLNDVISEYSKMQKRAWLGGEEDSLRIVQ